MPFTFIQVVVCISTLFLLLGNITFMVILVYLSVEENLECFCAVLSHSVVSDSLWPHRLWLARPLCPWGFSRQEYWSGLPCPSPGNLPNLEIKPRSPTLQADSLPSEPTGKPKNTGVGSLSLLQGNFWPRTWTEVSCITGGFFNQLSYPTFGSYE